MKKNFCIVSIVLVCCLFGALVFSGNAEAAKSYRLNLATATTGGTYYPLGNAMAQVWSKNLEGVKVAAQATAGTPQNVELIQEGDVSVAFGQNGVCYYAYTGTGTYEGKTPITSLRGMLSLYPNVMHFVAKEGTELKSLADFKGKKFVPGAVASATEINAREILGIYGLNYMDNAGEVNVNADFVGYNEASDLLRNDLTEGVLIAGGAPTAAVIDMLSSGNAVLVSLEEDKIAEICEKYPWYFPFTIKADTYPRQPEPVQTVALANILFTRADEPDELIYMLVKGIYDHHDKLVAAHKAASYTTLYSAMGGMTIPLHPGAIQYFQEQGVEVPEKLIPGK